MVSASSVIKVSIIGDVQNLQKAFGTANAQTGGALKSFAKVAGGALLAGAAVSEVFDVAQSSLNKADDFNDNLDRLSKLTTPDFARRLHDTAFGFTALGLSAGDVAGLATAFAAYATAAGAAAPTIEANLPALLDVAEAIHAKTGKTVAEVIDDIGKAIGGSGKTLKDYGIVVDATMNPDETILSILSQATTLFGDAKSAADDLHGTQDKINANVDNFQIKLGEALEGPLNGIASAGLEILDELKDWPGAIADILGPLARVSDMFGHILGIVGQVIDGLTHITNSPAFQVSPGRAPRTNSDSATNDAQRRFNERNGGP